VAAALGYGNILDSTAAGVGTGALPLPFNFTLPEGQWEFVFCRGVFVNDATIGLRFPFMQVFDDSAVLLLSIGAAVSNPGQTLAHNWFNNGEQALNFFGIPIPINMPPFIAQGGWRIMLGNGGTLGPGDTATVNFQFRQM